MIISENIKLILKKPFDNEDIETALLKRGIEPLRWAIVSVDDESITVSISYVKKD